MKTIDSPQSDAEGRRGRIARLQSVGTLLMVGVLSVLAVVLLKPVLDPFLAEWVAAGRDRGSARWYFLLGASAGMPIHEMGHVLAGWVVGLDLVQFSVGPLTLVKSQGHWRIRASRGFGEWCGRVGMGPGQHPGGAPRRQVVWFAVGGPALSLLTALGLGLVLTTGTGLVGPFAQVVILGLAFMSLLLGVATAIPSNTGGMPSDGLRILGLLLDRAGPSCDALCGILLALTGGARPRDWNRATVAAASQYPDATGGAQLLAYQQALDVRDLEAAREPLERALGADVPAMSVRIEAAFWAGFADRSASVARAWLPSALAEARGSEPAYYRALAAIRAVEGDAAGVAAATTAARLALRDDLGPEGMVAYERDLLTYVQHQLEG